MTYMQYQPIVAYPPGMHYQPGTGPIAPKPGYGLPTFYGPPPRGRFTARLLACLVIGWTFATILLNVPVARAQPDPRFPVPNPNVTADTSSSAYMHGWLNAQHLLAVARNEGWTVRGWVAALRGPHSMCVDNAQYAYVNAQPLSGDGPLIDYDVDQDYQGCMKAVQLQLENN